MSRVRWFVVIVIVVVFISAAGIAGAAGGSRRSAHVKAPVVKLHAPVLKLKRVSQGARLWVTRLARRPAVKAHRRALKPLTAGTNVDAASTSEDVLGGQSETAIAATSAHVMAAWNDATAFVSSDSRQPSASGTGVGYSADGGYTFTDLVGLPNNRRNEAWSGDPSVVSLGDGVHFIVSSLYLPSSESFSLPKSVVCAHGPVENDVAVSVATVTSNTTVSFTYPIVAARSANYCKVTYPAFLDKPFGSYNATSHTFVISYTKFGTDYHTPSAGAINMVRAVNVSPATPTPSFGSPIVIRADDETVVNQGASPAIANNGDTYVAWEHNLGGFTDPSMYIMVARVPAGAGSPDTGTVVTSGQLLANPYGGVKSLGTVPIVGYSRGNGQDFPSIAYNPTTNRVIVEWNDASHHPLGDIFLRSLDANLSLTAPIMKVNDDDSFALHFMPAVSVRSDGSVASSWYDRRLWGPDSTHTDYFAEVRPSAGTAVSDFRVTTSSTNWAGVSSVINPNFGDYTDNASTGTTTYFTWSDGRLGIPQPFVASH